MLIFRIKKKVINKLITAVVIAFDKNKYFFVKKKMFIKIGLILTNLQSIFVNSI